MEQKTGIRVMHLEQKGIKRKQDASPFRRKIFNNERYDSYEEHPVSYIPKYDSQQQPSYSYQAPSTHKPSIKQLQKALREANQLLIHKQSQINRLNKRIQFLQIENQKLKERLGPNKLSSNYNNRFQLDTMRKNNLFHSDSTQNYFPKNNYQTISNQLGSNFNRFYSTHQKPASERFKNVEIPETPQQHTQLQTKYKKNKLQTPQWNKGQNLNYNTFRKHNQNESMDQCQINDIVSPLMALAKNKPTKPAKSPEKFPGQTTKNQNKKYYIEDSRQYEFSQLNSANEFEESKTGFFF